MIINRQSNTPIIKMIKRLRLLVLALMFFLPFCSDPTPVNPPEPPTPPPTPQPTLVEHRVPVYFTDRAFSRCDLFTAFLVLEPVVTTGDESDINNYNVSIKNVTNLTSSAIVDEFAVDFIAPDKLVFVIAEEGLNDSNIGNTEIAFMSMADRVIHKITPINGEYSGDNWDPHWVDGNTVVWSHLGRLVQYDIITNQITDPLIPGLRGVVYDPVYLFPNKSKILYNARRSGKKNSYIYTFATGEEKQCLIPDYFDLYKDDNPSWYNGEKIVGHFFEDDRGRIYTRDNDTFKVITDTTHDFRYVVGVQLIGKWWFVFSEWSDNENIRLWMSSEDGTWLHDLNQGGDELSF